MIRLTLIIVGSCAAALAASDRILFDTDPGFFNDDGHAAVMLLRSPEKVTVLGMTLVSGNTWPMDGADFMWQALEATGRTDIPLFLGAQAPLVHTVAMARAEARQWGPLEYMAAFGTPLVTSAKKAKLQRQNAVDFLIQEISKSPGAVTVLAIGPMTNIAMALRLRPDLETKIKQLVFMGGNVRVPGNATKYAEANYWFDPEAAQVVLRSRIPRKVMFGLDICNRAVLTRAMFDEIVAAKTPVTQLYREALGNQYPGFLKKPDMTGYIWDPLAAGYLIDPNFVTKSESKYLDVDSTFGQRYGSVKQLDRVLAPAATPVEVMLDLDFPKFFRMYKDLLTRR